MPPTLFIQSIDDPWVPAEAADELAGNISSQEYSPLRIVLTENGGHNGFHGVDGCWGVYSAAQGVYSAAQGVYSAARGVYSAIQGVFSATRGAYSAAQGAGPCLSGLGGGSWC